MLILGADLIEHLQDFFVGAAVQRAGERGGRGGRCHKRVRLGAAHRPHGVGAAVLFVIGVQDEQDVEGARQDADWLGIWAPAIFHSMFMKFSV